MTVIQYLIGNGKGFAKCKPGGGPNPRKIAQQAAREYYTKDAVLNHLSGLTDNDAIDAIAKVSAPDSTSLDALRLKLLQEKHVLEMKLLQAEIALKNSAVSSASGNTQVISEKAKTAIADMAQAVDDIEDIVNATFSKAAALEALEEDEDDDEDE